MQRRDWKMSENLQLDLSVVLPNELSEKDRCTMRLIDALKEANGVEVVHVVEGMGRRSTKLCLHYDPKEIEVARLRELVMQAGAEITDRYGHLVGKAAGVRHERQARTVEKMLMQKEGVIEAGVSSDGVVRIEYDRKVIDESVIGDVLSSNGIEMMELIVGGEDEAGEEEGMREEGEDGRRKKNERSGGGCCGSGERMQGGVLGEKSELIFAIVSGVCFVVGLILSWLTPLPYWVAIIAYAGAYCFGGWYTLKDAIASIRVGRFEIDFLMLVAAGGAVYLGKYPEGAFLLFLFSFGHSLEHYAMGRARRAIEGLGNLTPTNARVKREGKEEVVGVEELRVCDTVLVKPDERIPVDGFVSEGWSQVDQSPITGESVPVDKIAVGDLAKAIEKPEEVDKGERVYAGTINGSGGLEVVVSRLASDSTLARLIRMVTEAETQKSKTQCLADGFEKYYVPCVIVFVVLLLFAWVLLPGEGFDGSLYRAIAVLVAASPCALAIATPSAVLSGIARAARGGVLVKGGGHLKT